MLSIPEIATQIVNKNLSAVNEDGSRTIFIVGSKSVGKSTLINLFLDKSDAPRETLVLEYSFGRKSNQKQGIEKNICHVWEYGGKLDILKSVLASVPIRGNFHFVIVLDLSKVKTVWTTLDHCINAMNETYDESQKPEMVIVCGKYDLFKNYDSETKKLICTTLRSVAIVLNAHLIFYSSKEPLLAKRAKDLFTSLGFGNGIPFKDKTTSYTKPLLILKGTDTWEGVGVPPSSVEQIKLLHTSRIAPEPMDTSETIPAAEPQRTHPEPTLDALAALKYDELTNIQSLDISIDDYLKNIRGFDYIK